ncbi:hypothetical protein MTR67_043825 [Solanum verrucosum]|uniref:Reverse transcriptase zinc-binding domain-containing protein n=1 Tax=Solanum verrucosum TaxID=315347 RepID=A0AAF0UPS1_SOLVR|nr:hypothetical protein MTR67_043825 [Solanum verrucosum]
MWRPQGLIGNCPKVNNEDNVMLKDPFETQEIWDRMKACAGDKVPGPNGFSMAFSTSADCSLTDVSRVMILVRKGGRVPVTMVVEKVSGRHPSENMESVSEKGGDTSEKTGSLNLKKLGLRKKRPTMWSRTSVQLLPPRKMPPASSLQQCEPIANLDAMSSELENNKLFTINEKLLVREEISFPHILVWIPKVPRKVCFFAWLASRGAILMTENLRKRKVENQFESVVFDAMPTNLMSMFPFPINVIKKSNPLKRNSLWEGNSDKKKNTSGEMGPSPGQQGKGGVGIKLEGSKSKILMKWLGRFATDEQSLWKEVILEKYDKI